jgi:hypothetical protein
MILPVKLQNILEGLAFLTDEDSSYLHTMTGEVVYITDEELRAAEEEQPLEDFPAWQRDALRIAKDILDTDLYLALPTQFDIHEYQLIERFCLSIEDDNQRDELCQAIRRQGTFHSFQDKIHAYGIAEAWYRYRDEALREMAITWCEEHGIPYTET